MTWLLPGRDAAVADCVTTLKAGAEGAATRAEEAMLILFAGTGADLDLSDYLVESGGRRGLPREVM